MIRSTVCSMALLPGLMFAQGAPSNCTPMTRYGVSGCEMLPEQKCPSGHHKQIVDPPDSRMKAPSVMMCVPDKPQPKDKKPDSAK